jgi:hypothetical protein
MFKYVLLLSALLFTTSCFKEKGAAETLRTYIEGRFQGKFDRLEIAEFLNGPIKEDIKKMSDEDFDKYSDLSNLKKKKFKVTHQNCSIDKCFITYLISYDQLKGAKDFFRVDSKKIAEMTKIEDSWKIEKVTNVKSYLESKVPIDIHDSTP